MITSKFAEYIAVILTLLGAGGAVTAPFLFDRAEQGQVISLTGMADTGVWTAEAVNGTNYWLRPEGATLVVRAGREVILRLRSADVEHGFAIPDLGIGPIRVEAGHLSEVRFTPEVPGRYAFQCTIRCGACHETMVGSLVVLGPGETEDMYSETHEVEKQCH